MLQRLCWTHDYTTVSAEANHVVIHSFCRRSAVRIFISNFSSAYRCAWNICVTDLNQGCYFSYTISWVSIISMFSSNPYPFPMPPSSPIFPLLPFMFSVSLVSLVSNVSLIFPVFQFCVNLPVQHLRMYCLVMYIFFWKLRHNRVWITSYITFHCMADKKHCRENYFMIFLLKLKWKGDYEHLLHLRTTLYIYSPVWLLHIC